MLNTSVRRALLSVFIVFALTACSSDLGAPSSTSEPEDAPTVAPTANVLSLQLDKEKTAKFSGSSTKNTKSFTVGAPLKVEYSHAGSGNFIASLVSSEGDQLAQIANLIGKKKATTWVYGASGKAHFEIIADGTWTITATTVQPTIAKLPTQYKGSVGLTTQPFVANGDITIKWSHKGEANFIVTLIDPTDGSLVDGVANVIGVASDETVIYGQEGLRAFDVLADGSWTLSVSAS